MPFKPHRPRLVQCTTCADGIQDKRCCVSPKRPKYSGTWRNCDWYHRKTQPFRASRTMPPPVLEPAVLPITKHKPPSPVYTETLASIRAGLRAGSLGPFVQEVINHQGAIAIRFRKDTPHNIKMVVNRVVRQAIGRLFQGNANP